MNSDDDYCYYNAADEGNVVDGDDDDNCHLVVGSQKYIWDVYDDDGDDYNHLVVG